MPIQFIYFDLGRVLLDFTHERGFRQIAHAAKIPERLVREALYDQGLSDRYELGTVSTTQFHRHFCEATNSVIDQERLCLAWGNIFEVMPQTIRLAASLRAAGYQLGILSNTCEAHWVFAKQRFAMLTQLFDVVITSYDVQSMKPDREIYDVAAQRAGSPPDSLFFTDDRIENVTAAQEQGWAAVQFESAHQIADELEQRGLKFNR